MTPRALAGVFSVLTACLVYALAAFANPGQPAATASEPPAATPSAFTDIAIALLAQWISESRDSALAEGTHGVPPAIRDALGGYVNGDVLDAVRWRVGSADNLSLQQGMFSFGDSPAMTLEHVIVFETQAHAADPKLWAHELMHVMQFRRWGVSGFASRYLADFEAVEAEAVEFRWQWMKLTGRTPAG